MHALSARQSVIQARVNARVAGGGAMVGIVTVSDVSARRDGVELRYVALNDSIKAWATAKYGTVFSGAGGKPWSSWTGPAAADDINFMNGWNAAFMQWQTYRRAIDGSTPVPLWDAGTMYDQIGSYDEILRTWEKRAVNQGVKAALSPEPPKDPANNPLGDIGKTITNVVWIVGIGIVAYFGLAYVIPALVGAGTATRSSVRQFKEA